MNEKIIYSLKDLILINQNKKKLLYFEIVEESSSSSKSKLIGDPESENISMSKYASSSQLKDQNLIVVEIKFQAIKFQQKDNMLVKISNIDKIVQGEHDKAKAAYQQALTATVSHEQMTPLNSILNLSDMLIAKAKDQVQTSDGGKISLTSGELKNDIETLKVINSSTHMMKIMNQSLLDSQAISDGDLRLCYRVMSPKSAIQ